MTNDDLKPIDYALRDQLYWKKLSDHFNCPAETLEEIVKNFPAYIRRRDSTRFFAHYELFKQVVNLPGCIVEVGVYKGSSLFTWSALMETFCPGDRQRLVYGFDHFRGLSDFHEADGESRDQSAAKVEGGWKASAEHARMLVDLHNSDSLLPGVPRTLLVEGDVSVSIPDFVRKNSGLRICLLHLDADLYAPTKISMEHFYPLVVQGGIVCLDEYSLTQWAGESHAIEEYFDMRGIQRPVIYKYPYSSTPGGYFIKV